MAILSENRDTKILVNLNLAVCSWPIMMTSCVYIRLLSASARATRVKERKRATWLLVGTKSVFVLWYSRYLSAVGCSQVNCHTSSKFDSCCAYPCFTDISLQHLFPVGYRYILFTVV